MPRRAPNAPALVSDADRAALAAVRPFSYVHPRLEVRRSPISGFGLFATAPIGADEPVIVAGGALVSRAALDTGTVRFHSIQAVTRDYFVADVVDDEHATYGVAGRREFVNHACDPSAWLAGDANPLAFVARRDLAPGDELTVDYATYVGTHWAFDPNHWMRCECGAPEGACRERVAHDAATVALLVHAYGVARVSPLLRERPADWKTLALRYATLR